MRLQVQSLALLSGLRIQRCCELWCGSNLVLLWLWCRLAVTVLLGPLTWEPPYAACAAPKRPKKKKKEFRDSRVSARWRSRKTLSSPPLIGMSESQLLIKQPWEMKKTRTYQKNSPSSKDKKGTTARPRQIGGMESQYSQIPYTLVGYQKMGE